MDFEFVSNLGFRISALVLCRGGHATHTDKTAAVYRAADAGDYSADIDRLNKILGVENCDQVPDLQTASRSLAVVDVPVGGFCVTAIMEPR